LFEQLQLPYPRVDEEDVCAQSHIFLDPPPQIEKVVFTSTATKEVKKMFKLKINNRIKY